jgi:hypothetical protein
MNRPLCEAGVGAAEIAVHLRRQLDDDVTRTGDLSGSGHMPARQDDRTRV